MDKQQVNKSLSSILEAGNNKGLVFLLIEYLFIRAHGRHIREPKSASGSALNA